MMQIWQLLSFLDSLSPFWPQSNPHNLTNDLLILHPMVILIGSNTVIDIDHCCFLGWHRPSCSFLLVDVDQTALFQPVDGRRSSMSILQPFSSRPLRLGYMSYKTIRRDFPPMLQLYCMFFSTLGISFLKNFSSRTFFTSFPFSIFHITSCPKQM